MIIIKFIKYKITGFLKSVYWLLLLAKAKKGQNIEFLFPIKLGGKTNIIIGDNCKIGKNVYLGHGFGSEIVIGNNCTLEENVELVCSKNAKIIIGDNGIIMKNTTIRTAKTIAIGKDIAIATNYAIFSRENGHEGKLNVGNGTHIGDNTIIDLSDNLTIGDEIAIGPNSVIYTHDHDYTNPEEAAWKGGIVKHPVLIKNGAWIGSNVTILPNVIIGERCVIAAGAVVTKNTDKNSIYGGVPAKKVKTI